MQKQAYLILAHKNDFTFHRLLSVLDDERNDLFIHMDKKNTDYSEEEVRKLVHASNVYFTKRQDVHWASFQQISAELELLKLSVKTGNYMYYHLISGEDFPLKSQDEIYEFFKNNQGKEFVGFDSPKFDEELYGNRIRYYHYVQLFWDRKHLTKFKLYRKLDHYFEVLQRMVGVRRNRDVVFQKGPNWFSITNDLAKYVLEQEDWIHKTFEHTSFTDELFLQTIVINSKFKDALYYKGFDDNYVSIVRLIDWNRGGPYVFRLEDLDELLHSDRMFARKFVSSIDSDIIVELEEAIKK